ncbi:MAG: hypothetical protein ACOX0F_13840 [Syntrophomonadaceae bacterium]|jgi:hypothetical protein
MIKALWRINADRMYEPGEIIFGLSPSEETELVNMGAAEIVVEGNIAENPAPETEAHEMVNHQDIGILEALLQPKTKRELLIYAVNAGISEVDDRMKKDDVIGLILDDAAQNGINIDAMNDDFLLEFALANDIKADGQMTREQLLDAIESHFGGGRE